MTSQVTEQADDTVEATNPAKTRRCRIVNVTGFGLACTALILAYVTAAVAVPKTASQHQHVGWFVGAVAGIGVLAAVLLLLAAHMHRDPAVQATLAAQQAAGLEERRARIEAQLAEANAQIIAARRQGLIGGQTDPAAIMLKDGKYRPSPRPRKADPVAQEV